MKHFRAQKKGYGVCCVRRGLDVCHIPAKKGVVPMHGYRNVTPNSRFTIFLFPDTFWVNSYPLQQIKGGENSPSKEGAWACLLGKNGAFLETLETRFLATIWVLEVLQHAPMACPVNVMVWNAGDGPWWAATAEILKTTSGSGQPLRAQTDSTNNAR